MSAVSRALRRTIVGLLLLTAVLLVQFLRASRSREAKLRPLPFRIVTAPRPSHPERAPFYVVEDLGILPGDDASFATAINPAGHVVGTSHTVRLYGYSTPDDRQANAFLWVDGQMINLGIGFRPEEIDASGRVLGSDAEGRPCRWSDGILSPLFAEPERYGSAMAVNERGWVAGAVWISGGAEQAFFSAEGSPKSLGTLGGTRSVAEDINTAGHVVGFSLTPPDGEERAFLWRDGQMRNLGTLGGSRSWATAINDAGDIVGWSRTAGDTAQHACRWSRGVLQDLGAFSPDGASRATDINGRGEGVGYCYLLPGAQRVTESAYGSFLHTDATGLVKLNTRIDPKLGWLLDAANAINDAGQIVGTGRHRGKNRAFRLTPIPRGAKTGATSGR